MADTTPIRSTCHCGAITVTATRLPEYINHCQCTICRRYGAAWGYYRPDEVKIETKPGAVTKQYIWGDRTCSFNWCDNCGCMCYWWPLQPPGGEQGNEMGINTSNVDPDVLKYVDRRFEYSYLKMAVKSKDQAHPEDRAAY